MLSDVSYRISNWCRAPSVDSSGKDILKSIKASFTFVMTQTAKLILSFNIQRTALNVICAAMESIKYRTECFIRRKNNQSYYDSSKYIKQANSYLRHGFDKEIMLKSFRTIVVTYRQCN